MTLISMKQMLDKAKRGKHGVGQFNFYNIESAIAIIKGAESLKSPVILGVSEKAIEYAGIDNLVSVAKNLSDKSKVPIALHLDHGRDEKLLRKCIRKGFTSVMIDGSQYEFDKNVKITKRIVEYAHKRNVSVEGELGQLKGFEDKIYSEKHFYTKPEEAKDFVRKTNVDCLAIAIGTSHGANKFDGKASLKFNILKDIRKEVSLPLVLHGASSVYPQSIKKATKYGAKIKNAKGVSDGIIKKAIESGIQKINTDTDLRIAYTLAIREFLQKEPENFDPRKINNAAIKEMQKIVEHKIRVLGSDGKA